MRPGQRFLHWSKDFERFDPRIDVGNYRRDAIVAMAERCIENVLAVMACICGSGAAL
jgi:hypothetical protein